MKHFFKKYISHFILERGTQFVVSWEIDGETYTQRDDFFLSHIFLREQGDDLTPLIGCVSLARLSILWPLSKSDRVVITWSPSGYTLVRPDCADALPSPCLLITMWQLVKAHGVTRNEPKIHVICHITYIYIYIYIYMYWWWGLLYL